MEPVNVFNLVFSISRRSTRTLSKGGAVVGVATSVLPSTKLVLTGASLASLPLRNITESLPSGPVCARIASHVRMRARRSCITCIHMRRELGGLGV